MKATKTLLASLTTAALIGVSTQAATITSTTDGDYSTGTTWAGGVAPSPTDAAVITNGDAVTEADPIRVGNALSSGGGVGSVTVENGSLVGGELSLAFLKSGGTPSTASLNIGSLGSVTLDKMWFSAATGVVPNNDVSINFTGDGGSLTILDGFNASEGGGTVRLTSNNVTNFSVQTYEQLWDAGYLTKDGESGLTSAVFADNFVLSQVGDDANDTITAVPEPSSLALLGLGGLLIARRRRG